MISGSCIVDAVGYSMLLGGILSALEVVYSEVSVLFGPCICVCALHGNDYGWRLCSCAECMVDVGFRKCDAFSLPQLAGLQITCCPMSSEHVYDIVYEHWHEEFEGACVGSFMWAASLAGLVHSSLSSSHYAALFHSFNIGLFAVNAVNACAFNECPGPPSTVGHDSDVGVNEHSEHFPSPHLDADYLYMHDGGPDNCAFTFDDPDPIPRLTDASSVSGSSSHSDRVGSDCDSDYVPPPPLVDGDVCDDERGSCARLAEVRPFCAPQRNTIGARPTAVCSDDLTVTALVPSCDLVVCKHASG